LPASHCLYSDFYVGSKILTGKIKSKTRKRPTPTAQNADRKKKITKISQIYFQALLQNLSQTA